MSQYSTIFDNTIASRYSYFTPNRVNNIVTKYYQNPRDRQEGAKTLQERVENTRKPARVKIQNKPSKAERIDVKINEGSNGLKFARIGRAIDELQNDVKCPFTQYYDTVNDMCVDYSDEQLNNVVCPISQVYDKNSNRCITRGTTVSPVEPMKSVYDEELYTTVQQLNATIDSLNNRITELENRNVIQQENNYVSGVEPNMTPDLMLQLENQANVEQPFSYIKRR